MIELLRYFGLPVGISSVSGRIDEIIVIVHYLMLVLFIGWGIFFIVSLVKFRASKNKKANYKGVESHYSSVLEATVAVIEIVILFGFAFPIWAERVNDVPDTRDAETVRVIAQQYAWNIHYPGPDGKLSYGGYCFPKDTNALLQFMKTKNTAYEVLQAVVDERNKMRDDHTNVKL